MRIVFCSFFVVFLKHTMDKNISALAKVGKRLIFMSSWDPQVSDKVNGRKIQNKNRVLTKE